jgi:hypothetical protein
VRLLQLKAECARRQVFSPSENSIAFERSTLALSSFVRITCEICARFNAVATMDNIDSVPLGAVISTAEAAFAAVELSSWLTNGYRADYESLKMTLVYSSQCWKLSGKIFIILLRYYYVRSNINMLIKRNIFDVLRGVRCPWLALIYPPADVFLKTSSHL